MAGIWIIGGANIDICGASEDKLMERDSNIGRIGLSFGGVGRNIAQTACLLGARTHFVTCFSEDYFGKILREDCEALGMDCSFSVTDGTLPSSMYIALLGPEGDMHIGMSDMRILDGITAEVVDPALSQIPEDDILVIDSNLDRERIRHILEKAPCRVAADPVSANKAPRLLDALSGLSFFKPNDVEAECLTGIRVTDHASARATLEFFLDRGVKEVILTLAGAGLALGTEQGLFYYRHRDLDIHSANGGGDALFGAYLTRRIEGDDPRGALRFAIGAAVLALEDNALHARTLTEEKIRSAIDGLDLKEDIL